MNNSGDKHAYQMEPNKHLLRKVALKLEVPMEGSL